MKNSCKILCALVLTAVFALSLASCDLVGGTKDCGEGNHVWSATYTRVTEAACEQNETGYFTCTVCEKHSETQEIPETALSHIWSSEYTTATPAACGKNETAYKVCTLCNLQGETIELKDTALEHTWSEEYTAGDAATCSSNATAYYTCTACEAAGEPFELEGTKLDHTWSEDYTVDKAATCLDDATGHKVCVDCEAAGETVVLPETATGHIWSEGYTIATDATCTNDATGYKTCTAEDCDEVGAVETIPDSKTAHTWSADYVTDTAASCGVDATGHKVCTECEVADTTVTIENTALAHDYTAEVEHADYKVAETVHDYYKSCKNCGAKDPALAVFTAAHTYNQKVVDEKYFISAATTSAPALYKLSCACGEASATETFGDGYALFEAGKGVYYNNPGEYTLTKNDWADVEASDFVIRNGATAPVLTEDGNVKIAFDKYAHYLVVNQKTVSGYKHVVETDMFIEAATTPISGRTDNRFGAFTMTAGANGAMGSAFINMYLHGYKDENGDSVIEFTAEGSKSGAGAPYTAAIVKADEWFNFRIEVTETYDEAAAKTTLITYSVYINGTLVSEEFSKATDVNDAAQKMTGFGFEISGDAGSNVYLDNTVFGTIDITPKPGKFEEGTGVYWTSETATGLKHDYTAEDYNMNNIYRKGNWANETAGTVKVVDNKLVWNSVAGDWGVWLLRSRNATGDCKKGSKHVFETDIKVDGINIEAGKRIGIIGMHDQTMYDGGKGANSGFFRFYLNSATDANGKVGLAFANADGGNSTTNLFVLNSGEAYNLRFEVFEEDGVSITADIYINGVKIMTIKDDAYCCQMVNYKGEVFASQTFGGVCFESSGPMRGMTMELWNTYMGTEE